MATRAEETAVRVQDRGLAAAAELRQAVTGLLRIGVDVLRSDGEVEVLDRRWLDENLKFRKGA